eukprot:Rhum_TRINITY_DN13364_c0_g1::Rhum_TRINITY_DN13364_c0_g1_i1::g.59226::m.59226
MAESPPVTLLVSSPVYAQHCSGTFRLSNEDANGFPVWSSSDLRHWLFSTRAGGWMISDDKAALYSRDSSGLIASVGKHRGKMPHSVAAWQVGDGAGWHVDPAIAVVAAAAATTDTPRHHPSSASAAAVTTPVIAAAAPTPLPPGPSSSAAAAQAEDRLKVASGQVDTLLAQCELLRQERGDLARRHDAAEADLRILLQQNELLQRQLEDAADAAATSDARARGAEARGGAAQEE